MPRTVCLLPAVLLAAACAPDLPEVQIQPGELFVSPPLKDLGARPVGAPHVFFVDIVADVADVQVNAASVLDVGGATRRFFTVAEARELGIELPSNAPNVEEALDGRARVAAGSTFPWPFVYLPEDAGYHQAKLTFQYTGRGDGRLVSDVRARAGVPDVAVYPWTVDFGAVPAGGQRAVDVTVDNTHGDLPVVVTTSFDDPRRFGTSVAAPLEVPARQRARYELRFTPVDDRPVVSHVTFAAGDAVIAGIRLQGNDCEGGIPTAYDRDRDGVTTCGGDCDDTRPEVRPGALEVANGLDDDCNGLVDDGLLGYDGDGDGYCGHPTTCFLPHWLPGDCHDGDPEIHPGVREDCPSDDPICADGIDNDCDGFADGGTEDADGDGYTEEAGDCDPLDGTVAPGKPELPDGKDNDCDGLVDEGTVMYDDDGDGFCEGLGPLRPAHLPVCSNAPREGDCDDRHDPLRPQGPHPGARVHPGHAEWHPNPALRAAYHGVDNNCDGVIDEDTPWADRDGDGFTEEAGDCDDLDPTIGPHAYDVPGDGVDQDCDPTTGP